MSDYFDATSLNDSRELVHDSLVGGFDPVAYDGAAQPRRRERSVKSIPTLERAIDASDTAQAEACESLDWRHVGSTKRLQRGEFLYQQGDAIERIYIVESGVVLLKRFTSDGREQVLEIVGTKEPADLTFAGVYDHSAEAANDAVVRVVTLSELQRSPAMLPFLFGAAQERARNDRDHIFMLGRLTAEQRLARFLLHLVAKIAGSAEDGERATSGPDMERAVVRFIPSRQQVADFTGLTLETVSRQLSQWRKDGRLEEQRGKSLRLTDLEFFEGLANA